MLSGSRKKRLEEMNFTVFELYLKLNLQLEPFLKPYFNFNFLSGRHYITHSYWRVVKSHLTNYENVCTDLMGIMILEKSHWATFTMFLWFVLLVK